VTIVMGPPQEPVDMAVRDDLAPVDLATPPDLATKTKGQPCTASNECGTAGGCVDGVCCETACGDSCKACNLPGREGTCSPVRSGDPPPANHPACPSMPASTCKEDGKCDGAGSCRKWPLDTQCAASTCNPTTNQFVGVSKCDGNGTCVAPAAITCAPYVCKDATQCWQSCTAGNPTNQCSGTNSCNNGSCGLKALGASCTSGAECSSGFCVDGVCCNDACTGVCKACNLNAAPGTCTLIPRGQDPANECPAGTGANATCAPGGCDGNAPKCRYASASTECRQPACDGALNRESASTNCDGNGVCPTATTRSCVPYTCGPNACRTQCANTSECAAGYFCDAAGVCQMRRGLGQTCSLDEQCNAGTFCSPEGRCCNRKCDGQCEACDTNGACNYVSGVPASPRAPCNGQGTTPCGGSCNGSSAVCTYPTGSCGAPPDCVVQLPRFYARGPGTCNNGFCNQSAISCGNYKCAFGACYPSPCTGLPYCKTSCTNYDNDCNYFLTTQCVATGGGGVCQ
jgi:hypothetical protein